ncbi:hypothetical protein AB0J96_16380 [Micromonospora avicenniae]
MSQYLRVLHATGLVTRARHGRHVLYRRSRLGDQLAAPAHGPLRPRSVNGLPPAPPAGGPPGTAGRSRRTG